MYTVFDILSNTTVGTFENRADVIRAHDQKGLFLFLREKAWPERGKMFSSEELNVTGRDIKPHAQFLGAAAVLRRYVVTDEQNRKVDIREWQSDIAEAIKNPYPYAVAGCYCGYPADHTRPQRFSASSGYHRALRDASISKAENIYATSSHKPLLPFSGNGASVSSIKRDESRRFEKKAAGRCGPTSKRSQFAAHDEVKEKQRQRRREKAAYHDAYLRNLEAECLEDIENIT